VRVAGFNDHKGGYIDNVLGNTAEVQVASNSDFIEEDFNDATYSGVRIGAKYVINDDWDVLLQHTNQNLQTEGVFDYDPTLGDLRVERFYNDELEDQFGLTN